VLTRRGLAWTLSAAVTALLAAGCGSDETAAAPFRAEVHRARAGDARIAWYERGSGPALVMATGTGSTMAEWDPALIARLARNRRVIVFDYPGIGLSSKLSGRRTSFAALADTVSRFMGAIEVREADVLGWSMGGFVAQQLAIRHPRRVKRLVLAGTNPGGDLAVLGPPTDQQIDSDPNPSDGAVLKVLYPHTAKGQKEGRLFLQRLDRASETGEIPDDFDVDPATVEAQVDAEGAWLESDANAEALAKLKLPTLVTGGTLDRVTPPINMRRIAKLIPNARLELFANAAHAFLFQFRERFADTLDRFLTPK
jgi:pimeloyl-ACP methyl ester carboxylesterase